MNTIPQLIESPAVRDLIDRLYIAFDDPNDLLTNPRVAPGREEIVAKALKHDRRNLPSDVIDWYIWCLITTIGTPQTLRHYLPSIIEELLRAPVNDDWWMFIEKMEAAGFSEWPRERRRLVCAAIRLWLSYYVMCEERVTGADFPELAADAAITSTPINLLLELLDPHRGTRRAKEGCTHDYGRQVAFMIEAERALCTPEPDVAANLRRVRKKRIKP